MIKEKPYFSGASLDKVHDYRKHTEQFDKKILSEPPAIFNFEELENPKARRFNVNYKNTTFECFHTHSNTKKLYVFLSAAGRNDNKTTKFDRVAWHKWFDGACLNIDDPMYKKHDNLREGWYYGTEEESYLHYTAEIINKLAASKKIQPKDITLIGSSASGYAVLYIADLIKGSTALSYNPQLFIKNWRDPSTFKNVTGVDLSNSDKFSRDSLNHITENNESKFIIIINADSKCDYEDQTLPFLKHLGIKPTYGINQKNNTYICLNKLKCRRPHHVFWDAHFSQLVLGLFTTNTNDLNHIKHTMAILFEITNNKVLSDDKTFYSKTWSTILSKKFPNYIQKKTFCDTRYAPLFLKGVDNKFHYELIANQNATTYVIAFHIENKHAANNHTIKNHLKDLASNICAKFKSGDRLEIFIDNVKPNQLHSESITFIEKTYKTIVELIKSHPEYLSK